MTDDGDSWKLFENHKPRIQRVAVSGVLLFQWEHGGMLIDTGRFQDKVRFFRDGFSWDVSLPVDQTRAVGKLSANGMCTPLYVSFADHSHANSMISYGEK